MKDTKFIVLSSIFFLMFIFGMGTLLVQKPLSSFLNAATANVSPDKSFLTAIPQVRSTSNTGNTKAEIKISVFIRDENGNVLPKKTVKLTTDLSTVIISPSDSQITDSGGKAEFLLSSTTPGKANLNAQEISNSDNPVPIKNTVSVEFTP